MTSLLENGKLLELSVLYFRINPKARADQGKRDRRRPQSESRLRKA